MATPNDHKNPITQWANNQLMEYFTIYKLFTIRALSLIECQMRSITTHILICFHKNLMLITFVGRQTVF